MAKLTGSFRGAEFFVETADDEIGRRNIVHSFPGNDSSSGEDRGKRARRFTLECIVASAWLGSALIKTDYAQALRKLEDALQQDGPGKLVHPYRGTSQVQVDGPIRVRQSTREGGIARISVTFVEVGRQMPVISVDLPGKVRKLAVHVPSLQTLSDLDLSGPDFLTTAVRAILAGPKGLTRLINKVNAGISSKFALIDDVSGAVDDLGAAVTTLINTPDVLALAVQNLINSVLTAVESATNALNRGDKQRDAARAAAVLAYVEALGSFGDDIPTPVGETDNRDTQRANRAALVDLVEVAGLCGGVDKLIDIPLANTDQAGDLLDRVGAVFDRIQERGTIGDDVSQGLFDLYAAFRQHIRRNSTDLSGLRKYTPPVTVPALVLSHSLFGTSVYDQELIDTNGISDPGAVSGGVELSVPDV